VNREVVDDSLPRWVLSRTSPRAQPISICVNVPRRAYWFHGEHIIVTACRGHLAPEAEVVAESHRPLCSNCQRIAQKIAAGGAVP
jgi:hypothetical protein